jgi:hypothetical protein
MTGAEKRAFFMAHWPGFVLMIIAYALMTAIRSFRDYFAPAIFAAALQVPVSEVLCYAV